MAPKARKSERRWHGDAGIRIFAKIHGVGKTGLKEAVSGDEGNRRINRQLGQVICVRVEDHGAHPH